MSFFGSWRFQKVDFGVFRKSDFDQKLHFGKSNWFKIVILAFSKDQNEDVCKLESIIFSYFHFLNKIAKNKNFDNFRKTFLHIFWSLYLGFLSL